MSALSPGSHSGSNTNYYGYYVHHDHQGSWDELTPAWGSGGAIPYSFDAFGKRREPDWTADVDHSQQFATEHMSRKGYTGHEHLDHLGLIHMRGRVQEPILGRMISRDPLLGDVANPETLNRYAYVENNPATLTDPTGFVGGCYYDCTVVFEAGYWTYGEYINHSTGERSPLPPSWTPARGNVNFGGSSGGGDSASTPGGTAGTATSSVLETIGQGNLATASMPPEAYGGPNYDDPILGSKAAETGLFIAGVIPGGKLLGKGLKAAGPVFKTSKAAAVAAKQLGFTQIAEKVKGSPVFTNGKIFISPDNTGHRGGAWKVGDSVRALWSKETRTGTYDVTLKTKVGD